jgi:putative inorganic carbon (HCO3(-)) transporter
MGQKMVTGRREAPSDNATSTGNAIAFLALTIFLLTVYIRPGEIVAEWRGSSIAATLMSMCGLLAVVTLVTRPVSVTAYDVYMVAFGLAATLSLAFHGWFGGTLLILQTLGPCLLAYGLTRIAIRTVGGLTRTAQVIVLLSAFLAANGLLQYYTGKGFGEVEALSQHVATDENFDPEPETRIQGTGIFNDPNDLAFALVVAAPLNLMLLLERRNPFSRLVYAGTIAAILAAIVLTRSRGGFIALLVAIATLMGRRRGWKAVVVVLGVGVVSFAVIAAGRLARFDPSEVSAQGRVEAWSVGLQLLKSHPFIGVGYGAFTDYNEIVAHNSYINVLAELGLSGGYPFIALAFLYLYSFRKYTSERLSPAYDAWLASGVGALVCIVFLSRQYTVPLFLLFGIGASVAAMRGVERPRFAELKIVVATAGVVGATYAAVMLFKAW